MSSIPVVAVLAARRPIPAFCHFGTWLPIRSGSVLSALKFALAGSLLYIEG